MKILHVTTIGFQSHNKNSGVPAVLKPLSDAQNIISNVESRVLSIRYNEDEYFDTLRGKSMNDYLADYTPDIVVFHTFYYKEYIIFSRLLRRMKIPYVIEPHGSFGEQAMKKSCVKKWVANHTFFRSFLKGAKAFIYTNEGEKQTSIFQGGKSIVIPNGVVATDVQSTSNKGPGIEKPILYFLGRFSIHHKGIDYLLSALDILDKQKEKVVFYFYGVGSEEETNYINERIGNFHNVEAVIKGPIFGIDKKKALEEANILVLTSRYEGSPMTIFDALSYGNPCVVTPGTNVADELDANKVGWKTKLEPEEIAKTILRAREEYLLNPNMYIHKCKSYVLENYAWDKIASMSIIEYEKIIKQQYEK